MVIVMHIDEHCTGHSLISSHAQAAHDGVVAVWQVCLKVRVSAGGPEGDTLKSLPFCNVQSMSLIQHNHLDRVGVVASQMAQRPYHT
jgi:hypothetical protein